MGKFAKTGWPIDGANLDEIRKMLLIHQDEFHLARAIHELVNNESRSQDYKFNDPKMQKIYNKVISCYKAASNK